MMRLRLITAGRPAATTFSHDTLVAASRGTTCPSEWPRRAFGQFWSGQLMPIQADEERTRPPCAAGTPPPSLVAPAGLAASSAIGEGLEPLGLASDIGLQF